MRSVHIIRAFTICCFSGFAIYSCDNEIYPQSPDLLTIPVIHSILELHHDTLCVRVTKTFMGTASAFRSAQVTDSIYFPSARVWLEKWNGNFRVNKAELTKIDLNSRLPGIFPERSNWNYILVRSPETETIFTGSFANQEYHLTIEIPGLPLVLARTMAYPPAHLLGPRLYGMINLFSDPLGFAWTTDAPYTELYFRLFYTDVYADTAIPRILNWREYHNNKPANGGFEPVFGQDFMKRIAGQVKPDRFVDYRHITGLQAVVVGIPADLHDYRLMTQVQPADQVGFPVTNIINGIGLFTSQTITAFDLTPDSGSKDSIMNGMYTRHLNFKYY